MRPTMFIGGDSLVNQEKNSTLNSIDDHRQQGKTTKVLKGFCSNRVHLLDGSKHSIYTSSMMTPKMDSITQKIKTKQYI